jgi:hypothetical protein
MALSKPALFLRARENALKTSILARRRAGTDQSPFDLRLNRPASYGHLKSSGFHTPAMENGGRRAGQPNPRYFGRAEAQ